MMWGLKFPAEIDETCAIPDNRRVELIDCNDRPMRKPDF